MLPEHEEILSDLKTKLTNRDRFVSLEILCARKIADDRLIYAKQGLIQLSEVLPKSLCSLVYQEFLNQYYNNKIDDLTEESKKLYCDLIREKVFLFAGDGLEEFDLRIFEFDRTVTYIQQLLDQLAKGSPKLKSFKVNHYCDDKELENKLLLSEFYSFENMPSLVVLEISFFPVKDKDLQVIGTCLPLLQSLHLFAKSDIPIYLSPSIAGLKNLTNLKALKHLAFRIEEKSSTEGIQLVKNCLLLMPQVNTVAHLFNGYCDEEFVEHSFPLYKSPVELGLEHLVLGENTVIPSNVTLPNVNRITVLKKLTISLKQFKKLSHLSCDYNNDYSLLKQALSEAGHLMKRLDLDYYSSFDIVQVLQLCPNLEELNLIATYFDETFHASQIQNHVQNLKKFTHKWFQASLQDSFEFPGLLHLLLTSCPKLEELEFNEIVLTEEEMELIMKDVEAGALSIQNLSDVDISADVDEEAIVSFAKLACRVCVQNCKILDSVSFNLVNFDHNSLPDMELPHKMQKLISNWGAIRP